MNDGRLPVPVGLVSKTYNLVQHGELIERALKWIKSVPGATVPDQIELSATANFERILAKFDLGEGLSISPDGKPVNLQLVCRNSVDGSTAIRARLGWYRLVCSNGMIVGVTLGRTRLTHKPEADLNDAFTPLSEEMSIVAKDREMIQKWAGTSVSLDRIRIMGGRPAGKGLESPRCVQGLGHLVHRKGRKVCSAIRENSAEQTDRRTSESCPGISGSSRDHLRCRPSDELGGFPTD